MVKIRVEGSGATIVSSIVHKALKEAGLSVECWTSVKPKEIRKIHIGASKGGRDVSIIAMSAGDK